ncbi:MAG: S8 family peptidase [Ilumatobacteraceae bacterium]
MSDQTPDPRLEKALSDLGARESVDPDAVTRQRHLRAMRREASGKRSVKLVAAAAVIAVIAGGLAVTRTGNDGNEAPRRMALPDGSSVEIALPELKPVDDITPVPFEREGDWTILKVDASRAASVASELAAALGDEPTVVGKSSNATTFVVPASATAALTDTTGIDSYTDTPVKLVTASSSQSPTPSWGLDRIDATTDALDDSYSWVSTGAGSTVYVIDTGVYSGHSDLSGRVISGYTAVADGRGTEDCNGHGTHVAGTSSGRNYGVAKGSAVVAVRVLDCNGSGYTSSVIAGINWVVASHPGGPAVINMSLGGGANSALDDAVNAAAAAGIVVVVAAGNSSADACSFSPARAAGAITIGATDRNDARASYSNTGSCVDAWAPGSSITSAWIGGSSATNTISGTSMASPHVAGLAARLMQATPGITGSQIAERLKAAGAGSTTPIVNLVEEPAPEEPTTTLPEATTTTIVDSPSTTVVEPPATSVPAPTTTVPVTTTTTPRPGNSGKAPGAIKAPGRNKAVAQPKEFSLKSETRDEISGLTARWEIASLADAYVLECSAMTAGINAPITMSMEIPGSSVTNLSNGRSETRVVPAPQAAVRCWLTAVVGQSRSARSNPAVVPAPPKRRTPSTTVPPVTTVPETTVPTPETTVPTPETTVAPQANTPGRAPVITPGNRPNFAPTTTVAKDRGKGKP